MIIFMVDLDKNIYISTKVTNWFYMKINDCEKLAEEFVQGKRGAKKIKVTGVKNISATAIEVKGYCEDTRFTVEINKDLGEIAAYDFIDDDGKFDVPL